MANSLRNKIKHFCYKGELSESERDRLLNALDDTELEQQPKMQDCEHCIHTYGTLGCCDMVDNKWIYDCEFGKEQYKKEHESQPCEDYISIEEAIEVIAGADETDGNEPVFSGKQVIKMLKGLPPVTPRNNTTELNRVLDKIITQIEQARDKDKLCEYPYNRCIRIIEEHRTGNSPVSVPAPKRKAAIERQVIVTWFTPEEKLPEEDIGVLATVTARVKNREFVRAILTVFYCKSEGWYELDYGFTELTVHAWCDLDPYEGG